jgi:putative ABC transport system permease protein
MYMEVSLSRHDMLTLKLTSADLSQTLRFIENTWRSFWPDIPFEGFFLDDDFNLQYIKETQMGRMLGILTMMGLVISCMGLLGLASFLVQHRTKEIGIRKVLGASTPDVMVLLSRQFIILVLIANVIAVPIAYMTAVRWLEDFAYRIRPSWILFAVSGGAALLLALMAVGFHALHAARANPVDSLRYE